MVSRERGGVNGLNIPMLSDHNRRISEMFGILSEEGTALRATFVVDGKGIIRHVDINDFAIGRSVDETNRVVHALQYSDEHGEVCQAAWKPGNRGMKPTPDGIKEYSSHYK